MKVPLLVNRKCKKKLYWLLQHFAQNFFQKTAMWKPYKKNLFWYSLLLNLFYVSSVNLISLLSYPLPAFLHLRVGSLDFTTVPLLSDCSLMTKFHSNDFIFNLFRIKFYALIIHVKKTFQEKNLAFLICVY